MAILSKFLLSSIIFGSLVLALPLPESKRSTDALKTRQFDDFLGFDGGLGGGEEFFDPVVGGDPFLGGDLSGFDDPLAGGFDDPLAGGFDAGLNGGDFFFKDKKKLKARQFDDFGGFGGDESGNLGGAEFFDPGAADPLLGGGDILAADPVLGDPLLGGGDIVGDDVGFDAGLGGEFDAGFDAGLDIPIKKLKARQFGDEFVGFDDPAFAPGFADPAFDPGFAGDEFFPADPAELGGFDDGLGGFGGEEFLPF